MTLLVVFLVSLALGLLGSSLVLRMRLVIFEAETVNLIALADGVLSESLGNLYVDESFSRVERHSLGNGTVESEVRLVESLGPSDRRYEVLATSTFHRRKRTIRAEVRRRVGLVPGEGEGSASGKVRVWVERWERVREGTGDRESSF